MATQKHPAQQPDHEETGQSAKQPNLPVLPPGSIYSDEEVLILGPTQKLRQRLLAPVASLLAHMGISANLLSYLSVLLGLAFCLLAPFRFEIAFWLLAASVLCDGIDGVEARWAHTNTAQGSFTDICCDIAVVAFSVAGTTWSNLAHPVLAILFVYTYTMLAMFLVLHRMLRVSTRGILRPSRMIFFAAIMLYFFFHINVLNYLLGIYLLAFPLLFLSFWRLRKAV